MRRVFQAVLITGLSVACAGFIASFADPGLPIDRLTAAEAAVLAHFSLPEADPLGALISGPPIPASRPVARSLAEKDIVCLTDNIYHEARGEGEDGWYAVASVVFNRVRDPRWPDTVCEVVYQPYAFSWTLEMPPVKNKKLWSEIREQVVIWSSYGFASNVDDATHYHADYVSPYWADAPVMVDRDKIGLHLFYHEAKQ